LTLQEEEPLKPSLTLIGTGFTQMFSDRLSRRFSTLLASTIGASVSQMGFLHGARSLASNLFQLFWGRLADRYGKRRFIAVGRLLNGVILAGVLFAETPGWLINLILLASICNSMAFPSWRSLLGDYASDATRGETIGRINSFSQMGSFTAMLIALLISLGQKETTRASYMPVIAIAAGMSLLSGILILFAEEKPPISRETSWDLDRVLGDSRLRRYLLMNFVYGMGMSFAWPLFPFVITDKLACTIWQIATFNLTSSAISTLTQRRLGNLMDRIGRRPVIVFSRTSMALAPVAYAFATQWYHITMAEVLLGVGMAAWMSSESTYIIDMAPGELRATYLAMSTAAFGVASFLGSNLSGYIVDTFFAGTGFSALNTGLLISAGLRFVLGLGYFTIYETRD